MICMYCGSKHTANCCCHKWVHVTISPSLFQSQQYRHSFSLITLSHVPIINHTSPKRDPNDVGGCSSFAFDFSTKMTIWDGVWTQNLFKTWTVQPRSATPSSENNGHALHALCWRPGCSVSDRRSRLLANGSSGCWSDTDLAQCLNSMERGLGKPDYCCFCFFLLSEWNGNILMNGLEDSKKKQQEDHRKKRSRKIKTGKHEEESQ